MLVTTARPLAGSFAWFANSFLNGKNTGLDFVVLRKSVLHLMNNPQAWNTELAKTFLTPGVYVDNVQAYVFSQIDKKTGACK